MYLKTLIITLVVALIQCPQAEAKICTAEAQKAKLANISHLVVSFEGLMSYSSGFVRKTLIKNMSASHPKQFFSKNLSYRSVPQAVECINDWEQVFGSNYTLSVIGHSFGGGIATFSLLEKIKNTYVDHVITLDPRTWSTDSKFSQSKSLYQFKKPANVGTFYNFYQRGGMPGYKVLDATNFELLKTRHTQVPAHSAVYTKSICLLFGDC